MTDKLQQLADAVDEAGKEIRKIIQMPVDEGEVYYDQLVDEFTFPPDTRAGHLAYDALMRAAGRLNCPVRVVPKGSDVLSNSTERGHTTEDGIVLRETANRTGMAATLSHELAHWVAHITGWYFGGPGLEAEVQAEGTSYLVMEKLGVERPRAAFYLAAKMARGTDVLANRGAIEETAKTLLAAVESLCITTASNKSGAGKREKGQ